MYIRKPISALALVGLLALSPATMADAVAPGDVKITDGEVASSLTGAPGNAEEGKKHFVSRKLGNCLACHANKDMAKELFHGEVGPALDGVADRYSEAQLRAILVNSKAVFPDTVMPAFYKIVEAPRVRKDLVDKTILTAEEVEDIVAYLTTLKE